MTIEEAREEISKRVDGCFCKNEPFPHDLILADKALEKLEKYKWHDLRENPKDLPKEEDNYKLHLAAYKPEKSSKLILHKLCEWHDVAKNFRYYTGDRDGYRPLHNVIAWKYIEPFKEKKNDK